MTMISNSVTMSMNAELNDVTCFLRSKHIKMSTNNEWLRDCRNFYISSDYHGNTEDLSNFVYEQWLLADLKDIGEQCLPPHIKNSTQCRLDGIYAVQVNQILNIGESCYSQLRQIRSCNAISTDCENEETAPAWQPKRSRTLKLSLTDGVQDLLALEWEPIATLKEPFIPGIKVLLKGPIECRRGILLLKFNSVQIIGGEVDSLLIENATENILARSLNLEQNPNPFNQELSDDESENNRNPEPYPVSQDSGFNSFYPQNNDDVERNQTSIIPHSNNQVTQGVNSVVASHSSKPLSTSTPNYTTSLLSNTSERNVDSRRKEKSPIIGVAMPITSNKRNAESPPLEQNSSIKSTKINLDTTVTSHFPDNIFDETQSDDNPVFLRDIKNIRIQNSNCLVVCRAQVTNLITKPKIKNEKWHVTVDIVDDTAQQHVTFSDTFLQKVFTISAYEVASQKHRMTTNLAVKKRIDDMLKNGVQEILNLRGRFHIQIVPDNALPVVHDVIPEL